MRAILKAVSSPSFERTIYITQYQNDIVQTILDQKRTCSEIAQIVGMKPNHVSTTLNYFLRKEYIEQIGLGYKARPFNFVVATEPKLKNLNNTMGEREEVLPEIEPFKPSPELKEQISILHKQGLSRTEIAKRLVVPKSQVIWTLMEVVKR